MARNLSHLDDPTLADAILDRVVHSSHRIALKEPTLRDPKGHDGLSKNSVQSQVG
jgi:hypothetical protein